MSRISFSGHEMSIEDVWDWYEDQKEALRDFRKKIIGLITNNSSIDNKFLGFSRDEINEYFKESELELDRLVCFNLISATEAHLRLDFYTKVYNKDKSNIGRAFREVHNQMGNRISLKEHIIEIWKKEFIAQKSSFSEFISLLNFRHWLAHGRYWTPKLGRNYDANVTYDIVEKIFELT